MQWDKNLHLVIKQTKLTINKPQQFWLHKRIKQTLFLVELNDVQLDNVELYKQDDHKTFNVSNKCDSYAVRAPTTRTLMTGTLAIKLKFP